MATFHDNVVSAEAPSKILVKNATLWRWSQSSSSLSRTGSAIPCSWFCIEKGLVSNISSISGDIREHPLESSFTKVIDAKDQLVIPGLHDAHIHVCMTGESSYFLNLSGCDSIDKLVSVLSSHSSKFPTSTLPWIQGVNWDQVSNAYANYSISDSCSNNVWVVSAAA